MWPSTFIRSSMFIWYCRVHRYVLLCSNSIFKLEWYKKYWYFSIIPYEGKIFVVTLILVYKGLRILALAKFTTFYRVSIRRPDFLTKQQSWLSSLFEKSWYTSLNRSSSYKTLEFKTSEVEIWTGFWISHFFISIWHFDTPECLIN